MKKLIFLFLIVSVFSFGETEELGWEERVKSNKKIESYESFKKVGSRIYIEGLIVSKVRIERIFSDLTGKRSEVLILKKDLEDAFLRKNKDIKEINITIDGDKGKMTAEGKANLLGVVMSVYLEGKFFLNENKGIEYTITKAVVNKIVPVPKKILETFSERLNPIFKLEEFGLPLYVESFIFEEERIFIR